ncbi:hypothetical protein GCM10023149_17380 [Mucilaginibacter gynuensis]|uniref:Uncharacterized protein n=1 Tax=Mucilaginibacter gynuensis TaxID=1302236 RepID=A0ABP8G7Q1_9SPHI
MRIPSLISLVGFILIIAGSYCPVLRPFGLMNWNVYDLNKPYGMVILLVAIIGMIGVVFNKLKVARAAAYGSLALVVLLWIAAYMKVHTSFSFLPFHSVADYLASKIRFKWGWYVLFTGAILSLAVLIRGRQLSNVEPTK